MQINSSGKCPCLANYQSLDDQSNCDSTQNTAVVTCSDGNTMSIDGCSSDGQIEKNVSCQLNDKGISICITCKAQFCRLCSPSSSTSCQICQTSYYSDEQGHCLPCGNLCEQCVSYSECRKCLQNSITVSDGVNLVCKSCSSDQGLYYDKVKQKCGPVCGDGIKLSEEQCDDGNTRNGDGCSSICKIENLILGCDYKSKGIQNCMRQKVQVLFGYTDSKTTTELQITFEMNTTIRNICNISRFRLSNQQNVLIESVQRQVLSNQVQCKFNMSTQKILKGQLIILDISKVQLQNSKYYQFIVSHHSIQSRSVIILTESEIQQTILATKTSKSVNVFLIALYIFAIFLGGFKFLWISLEIYAWNETLQFVHVEYPENVKGFFELISWAEIFFVPNPVELNTPDDPYYQVTPANFLEKHRSTCFLQNIQFNIMIFVVIIIAYPVCMAIQTLLLKFLQQHLKPKQNQAPSPELINKDSIPTTRTIFDPRSCFSIHPMKMEIINFQTSLSKSTEQSRSYSQRSLISRRKQIQANMTLLTIQDIENSDGLNKKDSTTSNDKTDSSRQYDRQSTMQTKSAFCQKLETHKIKNTPINKSSQDDIISQQDSIDQRQQSRKRNKFFQSRNMVNDSPISPGKETYMSSPKNYESQDLFQSASTNQTMMMKAKKSNFHVVNDRIVQDPILIKRICLLIYKACNQYISSFYGLILQIMMLSFLDLEMASMLQLQQPDVLRHPMIAANVTLAILFQVVSVWLMLHIYEKVNKSEIILEHQSYEQQYGILYEGVDRKRRDVSVFIITSLIKKKIFMQCLVLLFNYPYLQTTLCTLSALINIIIMTYHNPYQSKYITCQHMIQEFGVFICLACTMLFNYNDIASILGQENLFNLGWFMIGTICFVIAFQCIELLQEIIEAFKQRYNIFMWLLCGRELPEKEEE